MDKNTVEAHTVLEPGRVLVCARPAIISTVVGSAVAVTMWERESCFGGMCHYIYPDIDDSEKTTVKYGNVAIYALVKIMKEYGAKLGNLESHIIGGGEPADNILLKKSFGPKNVEAAHAGLNKYGVKIVSEDTRGHVGRKIAFNTVKNELMVYKLENVRKDDWHFE